MSTVPDTDVSDILSSSPAVVTSLDISAGLTEEQKEMQSMALTFAMQEMFPHMARCKEIK